MPYTINDFYINDNVVIQLNSDLDPNQQDVLYILLGQKKLYFQFIKRVDVGFYYVDFLGGREYYNRLIPSQTVFHYTAAPSESDSGSGSSVYFSSDESDSSDPSTKIPIPSANTGYYIMSRNPDGNLQWMEIV